jgi:hypothetical protein
VQRRWWSAVDPVTSRLRAALQKRNLVARLGCSLAEAGAAAPRGAELAGGGRMPVVVAPDRFKVSVMQAAITDGLRQP